MADDKTEQPTFRKLQKAREDGQAAKSPDLVEVGCLGAVLLVLHAGSGYLGGQIHSLVDGALAFVAATHSDDAVMAALYRLLRTALMLMLPMALAGLIGALFALAPQTGLKISTKPVVPSADKVNPAAGLKRLFSLKSLMELAKMIVKAAVLFAVLWKAIASLLPLIASSLYQPLAALAQILWNVLLTLLDVAAICYLLIGCADYQIQKWFFIRQNKMSKDEVKREHKDQEGDPHIKGKRRELARQFATTPPEVSIRRANMLLVNPTHYAVAVRYVAGETPLPVILARGADDEALRLRRLAFEAGVPIVANPPVARALYQVSPGEPIPETLFDVVAAILRWLESVGAQRHPEENAS